MDRMEVDECLLSFSLEFILFHEFPCHCNVANVSKILGKFEKVKEMLDKIFMDDPGQECNQMPNPVPQLLPTTTEEVPQPSQHQPPAQQNQSTTDELAEPVASPEKAEADPDDNNKPEDEPDPDIEEAEDVHNLNTVAEDFPTEEHHFQKHIVCLSEKQALIGKSITVKSSTGPLLTWTVTADITKTETCGGVELEETGVHGFRFKHTPKKFGAKKKRSQINFLELLTHIGQTIGNQSSRGQMTGSEMPMIC